MAYADHVEAKVWNERYEWLTVTEEREAGDWRSIELSPHGTLLTYDIEIAFCAGAWISVIVLAHAAIDATIRDTELCDYASNSKRIFGGDADLEWLRILRNRLVHAADPETNSYFPEGALDDVAAFQERLEDDA